MYTRIRSDSSLSSDLAKSVRALNTIRIFFFLDSVTLDCLNPF